MSRLSEEVEARLDEIKKTISVLEKSLRQAPDGRLRVSMNGNHPRFYHMIQKGDATGKYIRCENRKLAESLAQKDYDHKVLELLRKEEQLLRRLKDYYDKAVRKGRGDLRRIKDAGMCFFSGPEELLLDRGAKARKELIVPVVPDTETFVKVWLSENYEKKEFYDNAVEYITGSGIRVRSKSEFIIAEMLEKKDIPFYYEKPLSLRGAGTVHPDFTVLNVKNRKTFYWEHMGMMDDEEYQNRALSKINCYMMNGYFPGTDLILTYESSTMPIRTQILEKTIETYLES